MSTSTSLHTLPKGAEDAGTEASASTPQEPDVLTRERTALRELLRLVGERAAAEADADESRTASDTKVDAEYARTRQGLLEKSAEADREARAADEQRRRAVVDAAIQGEAKAKADFAAASRRIAAVFDNVRETAKQDYNQAKNDAAAALEAGHRKAVSDHAAAMRPLIESGEIADSFRSRLDAVAAAYGKFKLSAEPPLPSRESYTKYEESRR